MLRGLEVQLELHQDFALSVSINSSSAKDTLLGHVH